ncbi:GtrA family protein [Candidatus Uhrbacteria bacterium]|nr:GtrA family protein [Candidatus Uhrbacteria bacterium]
MRLSSRVATLRPHIGPFLRYCCIGGTNTALDFAIYTTLTRTWPFWATHYLAANALAFSCVVTWSFFWNKRWTFRNRERRNATQYGKFVLITLGGMAIAQSLLYVSVREFHLYDLFAKLVVGPAVIVWNFLMYRYWAFRSFLDTRAPALDASTNAPQAQSSAARALYS